MGMAYTLHKEDQTEISSLTKHVDINEVHEHSFDTASANSAENTAITTNLTRTIIERIHEENCRFQESPLTLNGLEGRRNPCSFWLYLNNQMH